ncbi:phosphate transport system substrate-binding protein [Desulfitispora alkaliphila]|uniref:phosphate ABC transporter substrate-binding protein n=1 Tax=Desulfitispora alkaliphila TaxID=622674 RepID=UPI003D1BBAE6
MRKFLLVLSIITLLAATTLVSGCGDNGEVESEGDFQGRLMLTGSSTLAPTIAQIADAFAGEFGTWDQVDATLPNKEIQIDISTGGSGVGAKAVIDGTANFGMLARDAREEEKELIEDFQEFKVGIDALLLAVHPENPIAETRENLTKEEIREIFSGNAVTWNDFDSTLPDRDIVLLVRDLGGGANRVFQSSVMGDEEVSSSAIEAPSMSSLVGRLAENTDAIGYASFGMVNRHEAELVAFNVEDIAPTEENILEGTYPIARSLYLVRSGDMSLAEQSFLEYIQSEKGHEIISEMGFLPAL